MPQQRKLNNLMFPSPLVTFIKLITNQNTYYIKINNIPIPKQLLICTVSYTT